MTRAMIMVMTTALLAGCAAPGPRPAHAPAAGPGYRQCAKLFTAMDRAVAAAGVADAQAARIDGYPYLRVNRFWASFRHQLGDPARFDFWVQQLQALDQNARRIELANLPPTARSRLQQGMASGLAPDVLGALHRCRQHMAAVDLRTPSQRARLLRRAKVPSDYHSGWRVLGLYPLTSLLFARGVRHWRADVRARFATPLRRPTTAGRLVRYTPPTHSRGLSAGEVARILSTSARNPLAVPLPRRTARARLFTTFAPTFVVDQATNDDRIGAPRWQAADQLQVNTRSAVVYRLLSHTRVGDHNLLQLNYVIWFPARPRTGALDLLGGNLDGLTWRVTLAPDGRPLVYDSMHNCGCYHLWFPTAGVEPRRGAGQNVDAAPLVAAPAPAGPQLTLWIAHRTHYLQHVSHAANASAGVAYRFADYRRLRSLPVSDGAPPRVETGALGRPPAVASPAAPGPLLRASGGAPNREARSPPQGDRTAAQTNRPSSDAGALGRPPAVASPAAPGPLLRASGGAPNREARPLPQGDRTAAQTNRPSSDAGALGRPPAVASPAAPGPLLRASGGAPNREARSPPQGDRTAAQTNRPSSDAGALGRPPAVASPATPGPLLRASGGRRHSMFAPSGLVPGSERLERWLLWPTGIASPGAMRQWGHHATAFIGRRHFDDPRLIQHLFRVAPQRMDGGNT